MYLEDILTAVPLETDTPARLLDEPLRNRQPEPGSILLGSKKGIEQFWYDVLRYRYSTVDERDNKGGRIHLDPGLHIPSRIDRFEGVQRQVQAYLRQGFPVYNRHAVPGRGFRWSAVCGFFRPWSLQGQRFSRAQAPRW